MRKIREVLRLAHELGLSVRQVSEATGVGKTAVGEYIARARVIGITWPIPEELGDAELERRLFVRAGFHDGATRPVPDWGKVHEELKRRGVTLMILWEEHRADCPDGHGYSQFCELYGRWRKRLSPIMRQVHVAGDKLFVDWAGDTIPVIDPAGEVHAAHLFVAALGASSYTYAEARWSETLPDWIGAHVNALDFLGGVMKAVVPTISRPASPSRRATSRASTGRTRSWPTTTVSSCCQRASGSRATRPRSRSRCRSSSATCSAGCATAASSRSTS
jgi:transposase